MKEIDTVILIFSNITVSEINFTAAVVSLLKIWMMKLDTVFNRQHWCVSQDPCQVRFC
jgi:hypothetical protein